MTLEASARSLFHGTLGHALLSVAKHAGRRFQPAAIGEVPSIAFSALFWARARRGALARARRLVRSTAILWHRPGRCGWVAIDLPRPGRGEVLVRTVASAVSPGSERAFFLALPNASAPFPRLPGYSLAGEVVEVGRGVTRVRKGDRVAGIGPHASLVLWTEDELYPVPDGVGWEEAAFARLGVIAVQAVRRGDPRPGESAVVLGQGLVGQLLAQMAAARGAEVISVARSASRRTPVLERVAKRVELLSEVRAEADVVFEATGDPGAVSASLRMARRGGRVVLAGSTRGVTPEFDFGALADREVALVGAHVSGAAEPAEDAAAFFSLLKQGRVVLSPLLQERVHPLDAAWFYQRLASPGDATLGAVFRWDRLPPRSRMGGVSFFTPPDLSFAPQNHRPLFPGAPRTRMLLRRKTTASPPGPRLSIGLVGCGSRGNDVARSIAQTTRARLAMVMDSDPVRARALGERCRVDWTTDFEKLLAGVAAVFIATPHHLHAPMAIRAAEAGKAILVEKPLADSLASAREMVRVARKAGVALSVGFQYRYHSLVQRARALIEAGAVGPVQGTLLTIHDDKSAGYWSGGSSWRGSLQESGGGVLMIKTIHYLDLLRFLTRQDVVEVSARQASFGSSSEVEDTMALWLRFSGGALGTVSTSFAVRGGAPYDLRIWGRDGQICLGLGNQDREDLEFCGQFYSLRPVDGKRPCQWHPLDPLPRMAEETAEHIDRFASAVLEGRDPEIPGEDGVATLAILEAAYRSAREGRPCSVETGK